MNKKPVHHSRTYREDAHLVREFQSGDKRAFDELVLRHKDRIFNLCYWYFQDYPEANEQAQEIFIKAYKGIKKFRFEAAFSTWLHRIAVNTCKNRIKSLEYRFRKKTDSLDNPGTADNLGSSEEIPDEIGSPEAALEKKQTTLLVQTAIKALPADKKTMILLRDVEGLTYEEIADITGLNQGTVKSKLARAREDLKKRLMKTAKNEVF